MAKALVNGAANHFGQAFAAYVYFCRTDRSNAMHNANNAGNEQIKPKWIANALNGLGVLRFSRISKTYLDINPVSFLNDQSYFSLFVVARLSDLSNFQNLVFDTGNGLRIFFNSSRWSEPLFRTRLSCAFLTTAMNSHSFAGVFKLLKVVELAAAMCQATLNFIFFLCFLMAWKSEIATKPDFVTILSTNHSVLLPDPVRAPRQVLCVSAHCSSAVVYLVTSPS
jgi:hypothetical protein